MLLNNRVVLNKNGTLTDLSSALNDLFADNGVLNITAATDKLYLGSDLPFNHRFFNIAVANDQASVVSVEIWDGTTWRAAVDVVDGTSSSGVALARSGIISWATDKDQGWGQEDTTEDIAALSSVRIYNLYWVRFTFSGNLKNTTAAKYVGHRFANDSQLAGYYPDLTKSAILTAHTAGKTDWTDQHCLAAEEIIRDLRDRGVIYSPAQLLSWEALTEPAVHKVAEIICGAFGEHKDGERRLAGDRYDKAMSALSFPRDKDADGHVDDYDRFGYSFEIRRR
jgi:hypothetical protein